MNARALVHLCQKEYYAVISCDGVDKLKVRSPEPLPDALLQELRERKAEILDILRPRSKEWHAREIAARVRAEGLCIFWSELLGEMVAYVRDESQASRVPCGIVTYTEQELKELFDGHLSTKALRLVHEAKRHGGTVTGVKSDGQYI
jgi:hypothetical protein